jgi:hypothetical protein
MLMVVLIYGNFTKIRYEIQDGVYLVELDNGKANLIDGKFISPILHVLDKV